MLISTARTSIEEVLGKAFVPAKLQENVLISKCGIQMIAENNKNQTLLINLKNIYTVPAERLLLTNLQTDYLDVFLLHRPSPLMQRMKL
jgi:predicted oxidoreductase